MLATAFDAAATWEAHDMAFFAKVDGRIFDGVPTHGALEGSKGEDWL